MHVNARNKVSAYPLHFATPDLETTSTLISAGAEINAKLMVGTPPLQAAIPYSENIEAVKILIAAQADLNATDDKGRRSIHAARSNGKIEAIKALIASGADLSARTKELITYLHSAVATGNISITEALITTGSDLNSEGQDVVTPLDVAIHFQNEETIKVLTPGVDANPAI